MRAMAKAKTSLLLHPVAEQGRQGEIDYFTRVHCYLDVAPYYPPNMMLRKRINLCLSVKHPPAARPFPCPMISFTKS